MRLMQRVPLTIIFTWCVSLTSASVAAVTPIQKVLQMLGDMVSKAEAEMHKEQLQYAGFSQFCTDVTFEKENAIANTAEQLDTARAAVLTHNTEAERLATEIQGHADQTMTLQADKDAATAARQQEKEAYLSMRQNITESLEALANAISVLKAQSYERSGKGPAALLQEKLGARQWEVLRAAAKEEPDLQLVPDVPTTAYKPKSDKVITLLEQLQNEFRDHSTTLDKEEADRQHSFEMVVQDRTDAIKAEDEAKASKTKSRSDHMAKSAQAAGEVQDLSALLEDDKTYLNNLKSTCAAKSKDYDSRQALRKEELAALKQAVEIISKSEVSGAATKHLRAAKVAGKSAKSLAQLRAKSAKPGLGLTSFKAARSQMQAAVFLRDASERLRSTALASMAAKAEADPFVKVRQLIEELIQRMMQEATNEAEHKGWCDTELATNEHTRKSKTQEVEQLTAEKEGLDAGIAQSDKDLADLAAAINATMAEVASASAIRETEKAENNATVVEAQQAQVAVSQAIKVLTEFYKKASQAVAFSQQQPETPQIFEEGPYQGLQGEHGGVLGMLDVILSDFQRLESETKASETQAQAEYDKFMEDSSVSKAQMDASVKHKSKDLADKQSALVETKASLESVGQQLTASEAEFEKLKPACLDAGQTYEERVENRKGEIEALKEALRILEEV